MGGVGPQPLFHQTPEFGALRLSPNGVKNRQMNLFAGPAERDPVGHMDFARNWDGVALQVANTKKSLTENHASQTQSGYSVVPCSYNKFAEM